MKRLFTLASVIVFSCCAMKAQVINIENFRIRTDTTGWAGSAEASAYLAKYEETVLTFVFDLQLQYKEGKSLFLMLTDVASVQANEKRFVNAGFQHFRYNYKITDKFVWEAFIQGQYNEPLALEWRFLAGTGPRYKIVGKDEFRLYVAALYMYELEKIVETDDPASYNRLSSYVSFTVATNENYQIVSTTYFQPRFDAFDDYRIATTFDFKSYFGKKGYLKFNYNLLFDTEPPVGVVNTVYNLSGGLGFEL